MDYASIYRHAHRIELYTPGTKFALEFGMGTVVNPEPTTKRGKRRRARKHPNGEKRG